MSQFNKENKGYLKGYPLFLGEKLGLLDTVNRTYPVIEELYQDQIAQLWNEFEVDLTQDKMDMRNMDVGTVDLMVKTLSWQFLADSVAGRSISGLLLPHVSNPEFEGLLNIQSFFETIHSRTYSHIVKQTFIDPNMLLKETYDNLDVLIRSEVIVGTFDALAEDDGTSKERLEDKLIQAFAALFALEAISFMASFSVTFAIVDTDKFAGIGKLVQLICRDEVLHTRMDYTILDIMMKDPMWQIAAERNSHKIKAILDEVVSNEHRWAKYIFSEGRQVIGLNENLLVDYVDYMAAPVYKALGLNAPRIIKDTPLPYMTKYIDPSKMQTANMELQNSSYLIGTIEDDTTDMEFDDL
jgi:ribonucleoside-diphosphate reductase beta chain